MDENSRDNLPLTPNCVTALRYLQEWDKPFIGAEITAATGLKGIHGIMNSLVIRGLVIKTNVVKQIVNGKGVVIDKECVAYSLTTKGKIFNINSGNAK